MSAAAIRRAGKRIMAALVPYYDWGTARVENMDARTESELVDGPVRYLDLQWLGLHVAFQFGRAPTRQDQPMGNDTTRRSVQGGAGLVTSGMTMPLSAMEPANRHGAWMAARASLLAYANSIDDESLAFDMACHGLATLEERILNTLVENAAEARAKLRLPVAIDAEGAMLVGEDAMALLIDVAPFLTLEG